MSNHRNNFTKFMSNPENLIEFEHMLQYEALESERRAKKMILVSLCALMITLIAFARFETAVALKVVSAVVFAIHFPALCYAVINFISNSRFVDAVAQERSMINVGEKTHETIGTEDYRPENELQNFQMDSAESYRRILKHEIWSVLNSYLCGQLCFISMIDDNDCSYQKYQLIQRRPANALLANEDPVILDILERLERHLEELDAIEKPQDIE